MRQEPVEPYTVSVPHVDEIEEIELALGWRNAMIAGAAAGVAEHVCMFPVWHNNHGYCGGDG